MARLLREGAVAAIEVHTTCYATHENPERLQLQPSHRSELNQERNLGVVDGEYNDDMLRLMSHDSHVEFSCNRRLEMQRNVRFAVADTGASGLIRQHLVALLRKFDRRRRRLVVGIGIGRGRGGEP